MTPCPDTRSDGGGGGGSGGGVAVKACQVQVLSQAVMEDKGPTLSPPLARLCAADLPTL